ncbi:hypothetical protein CK203_104729 [Vitis vinifera]|uniref:Uncharacterized protein n=1 Tax=Vitis vinifera TaxID=29760 RepID=A0A438EY94_VITVI|nr:hypothetical protein CK203_104729 [Vitis vinifera]
MFSFRLWGIPHPSIEVAILLSSEHKLYVLLVDVTFDGSGTILKLLGCHRLEDVREVLVGVGLQVVRVYIERDAAYMFLTRSMEKSRHYCVPCKLLIQMKHAANVL